MILAGDVGATKTLIGLFDFAPGRPRPVDVRTFSTQQFGSLAAIVQAFHVAHGSTETMDVACFGVAGPIIEQSARLTNISWDVNAADLVGALAARRVRLLNDLEAMAYAVPVLEPQELFSLQAGIRPTRANAALIAAGTGLGQAILHNLNDRMTPLPSEAGHADFAARTDRELDLVRFLRSTLGRVDVEAVLSGPGLRNLGRFTHQQSGCTAAVLPGEEPDDPARISRAAMDGSCRLCVEALDMFVSAYGAAAGNLALQGVATGGVYIGGGIAPRILEALKAPRFTDAFNDKHPMRTLMERIPISVILNAQAALLGAAVYANETQVQ